MLKCCQLLKPSVLTYLLCMHCCESHTFSSSTYAVLHLHCFLSSCRIVCSAPLYSICQAEISPWSRTSGRPSRVRRCPPGDSAPGTRPRRAGPPLSLGRTRRFRCIARRLPRGHRGTLVRREDGGGERGGRRKKGGGGRRGKRREEGGEMMI